MGEGHGVKANGLEGQGQRVPNALRRDQPRRIHIHIYIYIYIYMFICMYVCMYVRMYVCMYVCMYVWMN